VPTTSGDKIQDTRQLGRALRNRRKEQGLTQGELAQYCGCSVKFLSELENGKASVRMDKVIRVAMMLGCDLYLVDRGGGTA
jgi:y4mF family transcriptional regulator